MLKSTKSNNKYNWKTAPDIKKMVVLLKKKHEILWIKEGDIHCVRSNNSKARAYARIWGLPRIWQEILGQKPKYIIEVISEKFDNLSRRQKDNVLIHEIAHIPKTFSGALVPHYKKGKRSFKRRIMGIKNIIK